MNSSNQVQVNGADLQKFIQQIERKKEYNKSYYQNKTKIKRETEKQERELLKEKCTHLEANIVQLQNEEPKTSSIIENLKKINQTLISENSELKQQLSRLNHDNVTLKQLLDASRQRNYELMMEKADYLLPNIQSLTLDSAQQPMIEKPNYSVQNFSNLPNLPNLPNINTSALNF